MFVEEEIDRMAFLNLTESIPKIGPQSKFFKLLQSLKEEIMRDKVTIYKKNVKLFRGNMKNDNCIN